jgi:hypothetical protein
MASIRSKHHSLLNYFLHNRKDLSKAYVRKCEEFIDSLGSNKLEDCFKIEIKIKLFFDYSKRKDGFMGRENRRYWMLTATGNKIRITEKQYEALQGW